MSVQSGFPAVRLVTACGCGLFALLLIRTAWVNDDAYITFRTVDNLLNGLGARWNIANRVQAYTHPLWMLVMTAVTAGIGNVYYGSLLLSAVLSIAAVALVSARLSASAASAVLALSVLGLSKAFVDYSTSGLENPMTHFLLALFFLIQFSSRPGEHRVLGMAVAAALLMLDRIDTGLLVLPALGLEVWRAGFRRAWSRVLLGMLPLVAWEGFSLIYYGFPFPNTAYSKLGTGVPQGELVFQGILYLMDSVNNDPITLLIIALALASPLVGLPTGPIPVGVALYLAYIVWVGGDFMSGRFLSAPLFCAVAHLTRSAVAPFGFPFGSPFWQRWAVAMAVVWLVGLAPPRPTVLSDASYGHDLDPRVTPNTGIADERRLYYPQTGLLTAHRGVPMPNHAWLYLGYAHRARGTKVVETDAAGFIGYAAGPTVHYVDRYGLGDPLLARLPAETPWRIGHFVRQPPDGYLESLETGRNVIRDPGVAALYDRLRVITEGPIWSRERFMTIIDMNLGRNRQLLADYGVATLDLVQVPTVTPEGEEWNPPGSIRLTHRGARISFGSARPTAALEISVSGDDTYTVEVLRADQVQSTHRIEPRMTAEGMLTTHTIPVGQGARIDRIVVRPSGGDGNYSMGHVRIIAE